MQNNQSFISRFFRGNLILQICVGIVLGIIVALIFPNTGGESGIAVKLGLLGDLFVKALQAVAPILVFVLVVSAIANQQRHVSSSMRPIVILYLIGTFLAALTAVSLSFAFPSNIVFKSEVATQLVPPQGISQVLRSLLFRIVDNPVHALTNANYIGILAWGIGLGIMMRHTSDTTKLFLHDVSHSVTGVVRFIIRLAPFGIFGIVCETLAKTGLGELTTYVHLLAVLLGAMGIVALIINPIIVYVMTRKNPYPLIFRCLRESGVTAFFTRSSAANIPVNMNLCNRLNLDENIYSVSIPLGATINMAGAAITITVLTLAAANTLHIQIDILSALLLSVVAAISACGASGVAGGSLLLIPLACSLFGIDNATAMQVVGAGLLISVIQDSSETALNSSTDVVFTAAVCGAAERRNNQS